MLGLIYEKTILLFKMSSYEMIESAVKCGKVTYKALIAELCRRNAELADELLADVALTSMAPKMLRKKHRVAVVEKYGDDKEAIKVAMKEYDATLPKEDKPKRVPPVPRKLTDEEKEYNKSRNAYVKAEKKKRGDNITISEMKAFVKKCRADYDKKHKKSDEVLEVVEEEDVEAEVEAEVESEVEAEVETEVEEEVTDEDLEKVRDELRAHNRADDAKKAAKAAKKAAEKAEKDAEKALRKAADKAAKKAAKKAEKE